MKTTKRRIETFSYYDRTGIQTHLEAMAAKGWMLESIGKWDWRYRRTEPRTLHFSVNYFAAATEFDPGPSEQQALFEALCAQAGWQRVTGRGQMQIFCSDAESPLPIETDPLLEVQTIHTAMKKSYLPGHLAMLVLCLLELALLGFQFRSNPIHFLASLNYGFQLLLFLLLFVLCAEEVGMYYHWYRRAKQLAQETGETLPTRSNHLLQRIGVGISCFALLSLYALSGTGGRTELLLGALLCGGIWLVMEWIKRQMKKRNISARISRTVTILAAFAASFLLVIALAGFIVSRPGDFLNEHTVVETYEFNGHLREVYADSIPLRVEDLTEVAYDGYSTERTVNRGFLLTETECRQSTRFGEPGNWPELDYTLYDTSLSAVYELCLDELLAQYDRFNTPDLPREFLEFYQTRDAAAWQANAVYERYLGSEPYLHDYIICWDGRIVEIDFWEEPTELQIAAVVEQLKPA